MATRSRWFVLACVCHSLAACGTHEENSRRTAVLDEPEDSPLMATSCAPKAAELMAADTRDGVFTAAALQWGSGLSQMQAPAEAAPAPAPVPVTADAAAGETQALQAPAEAAPAPAPVPVTAGAAAGETQAPQAAADSASFPAPAPVTTEEAGAKAKALRLLRPNHGSGPDVIGIGIICNAFYGVDLKTGVFTADLISRMVWQDARTKDFLPANTSEITFSLEQMRGLMFLPDLAITNRDFKGAEPISSSITISNEGQVTKVDRTLARVHVKLDVRSFPFDEQTLTVKMASTTLMSDELVFEADLEDGISGAKEEAFMNKDVELTSSRMFVIEDDDGALKKSRAVLELVVARKSSSYFPSILLPELLMILASLSVFHLPVLQAFVMPRIATALISLVAVLTHRQVVARSLPVRGGKCWIDIFEEATTSILIATIFFNVLVEAVHHTWKHEELAVQFNRELRVILPCVASVPLISCAVVTDPDSGPLLSFCCRLAVLGTLSAYAILSFLRIKRTVSDPS